MGDWGNLKVNLTSPSFPAGALGWGRARKDLCLAQTLHARAGILGALPVLLEEGFLTQNLSNLCRHC